MTVKTHKFSILGTGDLELTAIISRLMDDFKNWDVNEIIVEIQDPLEDAMAFMAWPGKCEQAVTLANALCRYKTRVVGVQKTPLDSDFTVSLLVGSYMDYRPRVTEMVDCLERNIQNPKIGDIHLFVEDPVIQWENWFRVGDWESSDIGMKPQNAPFAKWQKYPALEKLDGLRKHPKVKVVPFGRRPFFAEYFEYANQTFPKGRTVVLANSDMGFDDTVALLGDYSLEGVFGCLARESGRIFANGPHGFPCSMSADAWVFTTPTKNLEACSWPLGVRAGECLLAHMVREAGYLLLNPCLSVHTMHHHDSDVRRWHKFPPITSMLPHVPGVSLEALKGKRFAELKQGRSA